VLSIKVAEVIRLQQAVNRENNFINGVLEELESFVTDFPKVT